MLSDEPARRRKLSDYDVRELLAVVSSDGAAYDRDRALVLFIHATDMRTSEVEALIWEDVTMFEDGVEIRIQKDLNRFRKQENTYLFLPYSEDIDVCVGTALETWNENILASKKSAVFRAMNKHGHVSADALSANGIRWVLNGIA